MNSTAPIPLSGVYLIATLERGHGFLFANAVLPEDATMLNLLSNAKTHKRCMKREREQILATGSLDHDLE